MGYPALDQRLSTVAEMVREGVVLADIGTDHAYLAANLAGRGVCPLVYACDINDAPLEMAKDTVAKYGLSQKIKVVLSDGLKALPEGCAQDIVVAGMGGDLIASIIDAAPWLKNPKIHLILQPMTSPEDLRYYLFSNGYDILQEVGVHMDYHYYTVIMAQYTGNPIIPNVLLQSVGRLPQSDDIGSAAYIKHYLSVLQKIISGLEKAKSPEKLITAGEYRTLVQQIQEAVLNKCVE